MKSGCALKNKRLKVPIYIVRLIFYLKKIFLNSVSVSVKVICFFREFGKLFRIIRAI